MSHNDLMTTADIRPIRRLGYHEAYQLAMHTLGQYRGTIVACRYRLPSGIATVAQLQWLKGRVSDAITDVVLAQAHLRVGITGENSKVPEFVRLDRLELRQHLDWRLVDDSIELEPLRLALMQRQLDTRYNHLSTRPGWKVVILYQATANFMEVLYIWNHTHHDGMSGKIFHQQLLQNLNKKKHIHSQQSMQDVHRGSDGWVVDLPDPSDNLPPPPEMLTDWPMSTSFLLKTVWKELKPYSIFSPSSTHATWAPIQTTPFVTQFQTFIVNNDVLEKVIGACRRHHTTLTGLIHALTLLSLTTTLKNTQGFASRTPYDLRPFLPSETPDYPWLRPKESMCNYVSVLDHEFDPELIATIRSKLQSSDMGANLSPEVMKIVWSVSARIKQEIKARLDYVVKNDMIGIMKFVSDWRAQQESEARKPRYLSWLVTNLGILDGNFNEKQDIEPELDQGWSINRAELVLSAEVPSAAISISAITVKGEKTCITCSWQDCVVDSKVSKRLVGDLEAWLHKLGS